MKSLWIFLVCVGYSFKRLWAIAKPARIRWKPLTDGIKRPVKAYKEDSGWDVYAAEDLHIKAGEHLNVGCGIAIEVESGWGYSIRGRSGLNKKGVIAALGLVDSWYHNEIRVVLSNFSGEDFDIKKGDRAAQLFFHPVMELPWERVEKFKSRPGTRGQNGWGSSGGFDNK